MELYYKGSIRRLSGYGMAYANFDKAVGEDKIGQKETTAVPDSHLIVHSMNEEGIDFSFFFFEKEDRYFVRKGEEIHHKHEGNAFGFELTFSVKE